MKVTLRYPTPGYCIVEREPGDPVFRDSSWGSGESRLLYHVKRILNKRGHDFIKKRMHKDGHMVSENQLYLRTRRTWHSLTCFAIWNSNWAVAGVERDFNENGIVILAFDDLGWKQLKGEHNDCK